jgi:hypothetical protein
MSCVDFDTGEVIDPERLENLQMERNQKIENVVLWIKNLESDALAIKTEKEALAKRQVAALAKAEQLKEWLGKALEGQKFSTAKCAVSFRKSEKTEVFDAGMVPSEYTKTKIEPDVAAIKAALKEGLEISGCRLVENQNVQIR